MTEQQRIRYWDIIKAIGIIAVIIGHAPTSVAVTKTVYSFHLMLFFFAAGATFAPKNSESFETLSRFTGKMVLKNLRLFFTYNCIFALLHNLFVSMGILESSAYTLGNIVKAALLSFTFYAPESYEGAMWFVPVLMVSLIIMGAILLTTRRLKNAKIANGVIFALSAIFAMLLYQHEITLAYFLQVSFLALPITFVGYLYSENRFTLDRYITWYGAVIAGALMWVILRTSGGMVELSVNQIISVVHFYPLTLAGIYVCLYLGKLIESSVIANSVSYIGRKSFHLMAMHFAAFKLMDFLYCKLWKTADITQLNAFPSSHFWPGIIYICAGVLIPTLVCYGIDSIRAKLKRIALS